MSTVSLLAEPSPWIEHVLEHESLDELLRLTPWALPAWTEKRAPRPLRRFVGLRAGASGQSATGFTALELAARAYSRGRRDRLFNSQFALRQLSSRWAATRSEVSDADRIYAPSLAARRLFARNPHAEKVLALDLPVFRTMHEDLDRAALIHPNCKFLRRYRAPGWALVDQECEFAMADKILVRGRFAQQALAQFGVPLAATKIHGFPVTDVPVPAQRQPGSLRVLLAGLAAARHGTGELLNILEGRPWLRIALRPGEGAEPAELIAHPQVGIAGPGVLSTVDAVIAPSLCEAYHAEVSRAAAAGIPVIATMRGAGAVAQEQLMIELPSAIERGLACSLDALYGAEAALHHESSSTPRPASH